MADVPLRIKVIFEDRAARAGIDRLQKKSKEAGAVMKKSFSGGAFAIRGIATELNNALRGLTIALGAVTAAGGLLARQAVNMSAEFEVLAITFEVLTGSVETADQLIREMKDFAVKTPLQLKDVETAGTTLLALGEAASDVIPILRTLGQAAVAMNLPLEQFIRARQLLSQGIVLTRTLTPLGISRDLLTEFGAGAGATGAELVEAFDKALGRFEGLFARTLETIRGKLSNLKDEIDVTFAAIGDPIRDILISTVNQITAFLAEVRTFFEQNKGLIEESFAAIKAAAENYIKPVTDIMGDFLNRIKETPEYIRVVTDTFIKLATAATNLLIIGTLTTAFISFTATIVLLKLSLPVVMATFGIAPGVIARTTIAVKGLTTSVTTLKGAMIGLKAATLFIPLMAVAILVIRDAWIEVEKALMRYQQRLMGVQAGMHVVSEGEMGAISTLRGIASEGAGMSEAEKIAAARLFMTSGGLLGISPARLGFTAGPTQPDIIPPTPPRPGGGGATVPIIEFDKIEKLDKALGSFTRQVLAVARHLKDEIRARAELLTAIREEIISKESLLRQEAFMRGRMKIPSEAETSGSTLKDQILDAGFSTLKEYEDSLGDLSSEFMRNLSRTLGNFLEQWGRTGGKPDVAGLGLDILKPLANQAGAGLAQMWNLPAGGGGFMAGAMMGAAGWIANRLQGEDPLKIEQPVDIRIVDIETRLKNFFNFRGLDPFTYGSPFKLAFENGVY